MKSGYVSYKIYLFSGKVPRKGERSGRKQDTGIRFQNRLFPLYPFSFTLFPSSLIFNLKYLQFKNPLKYLPADTKLAG
jgi:hypothetical protein